MYTNSKVVAASKEKDEKKWYRDNMESKDSDGPLMEDENGAVKGDEDEGVPCAMDNEDAPNYDGVHLDDEAFDNPVQHK